MTFANINKLVSKVCDVCGISYLGRGTGKRCSNECRKALQTKLYGEWFKNKQAIYKNCVVCKAEFKYGKYNKKACSEMCRKESELITNRKHYAKTQEKITEDSRKKYKNKKLKNNINYIPQIQLPELNKEDMELYPLILVRTKETVRKEAETRRVERFKNDPSIKLKDNIARVARGYCIGSHGRRLDFLEWEPEDLQKHLESLWEPWMNWDNYGIQKIAGERKWHIDHIIPQSLFKFINKDGSMNLKHILICWNLKNIKPLGAVDNISKGKKITSEAIKIAKELNFDLTTQNVNRE